MNHLQNLKAKLQSFKACILVNNNLSRNLVSLLELPMKFNERFKSYVSSIFDSRLQLIKS